MCILFSLNNTCTKNETNKGKIFLAFKCETAYDETNKIDCQLLLLFFAPKNAFWRLYLNQMVTMLGAWGYIVNISFFT
jgi:hypothetical protein